MPKRSKENDVAEAKKSAQRTTSREQCNAACKKEAKATSASKPLKKLADITALDSLFESEVDILHKEKSSKKARKNNVGGKSVQPLSSREQCNETLKRKAKATNASKPSKQPAKSAGTDPDIPPDQQQSQKETKFKISSLIETKGTKYNLLYIAMTKDVNNLAEGYECLRTFREAELREKDKGNPACIMGFCIGKVKFVMRKQFNKIPNEDAITPKRFASILTVAADKLFREKLVSDPVAMKTAFETIKNGLGKAHGFLGKCIPETEEQKKLFYYYLVTTISMNTLMEINPISCMAIAKWRLNDDNFKRLGLHNKAMDIDETYARCLSDIRATTKYVIKTRSSCFHFKPDDIIDNKVVMEKIMGEFSFLKKYADKPFTKRFQF